MDIKQKNTGFTIVELVVVIAVIAILVAVGVVGYSTWRQSVVTTAVKSDLSGAAVALQNARNFDGQYPTTIPSSFSASEGVTMSGGGRDGGKNFCIQAVSTEKPSIVYHISSAANGSEVSAGECPPETPTETVATPITWTTRTGVTSRTWSDIAMTSDGLKIVVVSADGVIKQSTNLGGAWSDPSWYPSGASYKSVAMSGTGDRIIALSTNQAAYVSTNSGDTYGVSSYSGAHNWSSVAYDATGGFGIAGVTSGNVYTFPHEGLGYYTLNSGPPSADWTGVAAADSSRLVAVANARNIYTSSNSGTTWVERTGSGARYWRGVAISSDGAKLVAVSTGGYGGYIYTSADSGVTWTERTEPGSRGWTAVESSANGMTVIATSVGGVYVSYDAGATWVSQDSLGGGTWTSAAISDDGKRFAVSSSPGYVYTGILD